MFVSAALAASLPLGYVAGPLKCPASKDNVDRAFASNAGSGTPNITVTRANTGNIILVKGASYKLGVKTSGGKVVYKSSSSSKIKVSQKGVVRALGLGKATVTITVKAGREKSVKKIRVRAIKKSKYVKPKKVKLAIDAKPLKIGSSVKARVAFTPKKASNKNVVFKSSNSSVASVSASGTITAKKAGTAKITVKSCANKRVKASVRIEVPATDASDASVGKPANDAANDGATNENKTSTAGGNDTNVEDDPVIEDDPVKLRLYALNPFVTLDTEDSAHGVVFHAKTSLEALSIPLFDERTGEKLTELVDDGGLDAGGSADEVAGDGTHTGVLDCSEQDEATVGYIAKLDGIVSNTAEVEYCAPLGDDELAAMAEVDEQLQQLSDTDAFTGADASTRAQAACDLLEELAEQGLVEEDATSYEEGDTMVGFEYADGVLGAFTVEELGSQVNGAGSRLNGAQSPKLLSTSELAVPSATGKALILNGFPEFEETNEMRAWRTDPYKTMRDRWNEKGMSTKLLNNINVSSFYNLDAYDFVAISTHGTTYKWGGWPFSEEHKRPVICVRENVKSSDRLYSNLLKEKLIARHGEKGYLILPEFFDSIYPNSRLDDTFVFSECCCFMGETGSWNHNMSGALLDAGCEAVVGFYNSVLSEYSVNFLLLYVAELLETGNANSAFVRAKAELGATDEAYWKKCGYTPDYSETEASEHNDGEHAKPFLGFYDAKAPHLMFKHKKCSVSAASVKRSFSAYTWSELKAIADELSKCASGAQALTCAAKYKLVRSNGTLTGGKKPVTLSDGSTAHVRILGFYHDEKSNGGKAGISFEVADIRYAATMNSASTNEGGWRDSKMRSYLNSTFLSRLPSDLKSCIAVANKRTNNIGDVDGDDATVVTETSDALWLLSPVEVYGRGIDKKGYKNRIVFMAEGSQYQLYEDNGVITDKNAFCSKSTTTTGAAYGWWLRSPNSRSDVYPLRFDLVDAAGDLKNADASAKLGVAPGFCF